MDKRTTDYVGKRPERFDENKLNKFAEENFAKSFIQKRIDEGYKHYNSVLDVSEKDIPKKLEKLVKKILMKHRIAKEEYKQKVFKIFKNNLREKFAVTKIFEPMDSLQDDFFKKLDDDKLNLLILSALANFFESTIMHMEIMVYICTEEDISISEAEKIADKICAEEYGVKNHCQCE